MNVKIPTSFLWPVITRSISHRIYRIAFKNAFPVAFNYSEVCDCNVFNLNHYLLLSYSRMNKVIKRNIIWDISSIFISLLQFFKCLKEYYSCKLLHKDQVVMIFQSD